MALNPSNSSNLEQLALKGLRTCSKLTMYEQDNKATIDLKFNSS